MIRILPYFYRNEYRYFRPGVVIDGRYRNLFGYNRISRGDSILGKVVTVKDRISIINIFNRYTGIVLEKDFKGIKDGLYSFNIARFLPGRKVLLNLQSDVEVINSDIVRKGILEDTSIDFVNGFRYV